MWRAGEKLTTTPPLRHGSGPLFQQSAQESAPLVGARAHVPDQGQVSEVATTFELDV